MNSATSQLRTSCSRWIGVASAMLQWLAVLVAFICGPGLAPAQTAPAGNEHPAAQDVASAASTAPPFGPPEMLSSTRTAGGDPALKSAFAAQLDLEPLRAVAVFHSGRVKVLDTLARDTVRKITGRTAYFDVLPGSAAAPPTAAAASPTQGEAAANLTQADTGTKFSYDPVFTLLDLIIDPAYYLDKPLLYVNYLPLRREFFEASFPASDAVVDRWMKLQRVTPLMVDRHASKILDLHAAEPLYRAAFDDLDRGISLWQNSAANMLLVAPATSAAPWAHISSLPDAAPARRAALELGAAWRARDAARANAAITSLAAALPTINPATYPEGRRTLEVTYNRARAFEWGMWAYCLAFVALILGFGTGRRTLLTTGTAFLIVAIIAHAAGFAVRCILAERFAIQNQFESMTGVSLFAALVGLVIMLARRQYLFGAAAAGVGFLVLITATQTAIPGQVIEREAAILNTSVLLKYHVTTVLLSYGLIALGFLVSIFYLAVHYAGRLQGAAAAAAVPTASLTTDVAAAEVALGRAGDAAPLAGRAKTLADLDTAQMTVLQLAFWTLGVGILLGAWWADHSWGRWWAFDPKETWALLTWIVYLIVIHLRFATVRNRALVTAWLSVVGFIVMLWTYLGVNLLLPGLHAYA